VISPLRQSTSPAADRRPRRRVIPTAPAASGWRDHGGPRWCLDRNCRRAVTTAVSKARGSDARRQPATAGTAPANDTRICPVACRYRYKARTAVTVAFADETFRSWQ
jgi:hypothetical protein